MKKLLESLKQYVRQNPPDYGDAESVLDVLYWRYTEYNNAESEKIKEKFAALRKLLNLPL